MKLIPNLKAIWVFFLLLLNFCGIAQQTYYLSNNGDDNLDGKSPENAWASIHKLNNIQSQLNPGDKVLFCRGSIFRGQINLIVSGIVDKPIVFGSYGTGEIPQINGSLELTNWEKVKDNVYKTYYSGSKLTNMFLNGKQMIFARYPNTGFLSITSANGNTGFKCDKLIQESQYWKGANVRVRTENWVWEARKVKSFIAGAIVFDTPTAYTTDNGWGFYLDGKLEALDSNFEWYWDPIAQYVYIYLPAALDPATCRIEASNTEYGITGSVHHFKIENIAVVNQSKINIDLKGDYNIIKNCSAQNAWETAISVYGNHLVVDSNFISTRSGRGIFGYGNNDISISHNLIKNIGLTEGYGKTGDGAYKGIFIDHCKNAVVSYNHLDSIGYAGINIYGEYSLVEKNIIDHTMLILDDGAALYGWGSYTHHNTWRNNLIYNATGSGKAKSNNERMALGIYLDNGFDSSLVINNTVINCAGGILNNADANYNTYIGNTVFGKSDGLSFANWGYPNAPIRGCMARKNVLYSTLLTALPVNIQFNVQREVSEFDSNYYFNPYKDFYFPGARSFSDWGNYFDDKDSKTAFFKLNDVNVQVAEIFVNETDSVKTIFLPEFTYLTLDSILVKEIKILPYSSKLLINFKKMLQTSVQNAESKVNTFGVYPNPCLQGQMVCLSLEESKEVTVFSIFNLMGKLMAVGHAPACEHQYLISTENFPPGCYLIKVTKEQRIESSVLYIQ